MTVLGGIDRRLLQNVDWPLLGAVGGLVVLSATTLASLHIGRAGGNVAVRQLAWFALGLCALVIVASIDYRRLVRLAPLLFVMGLLGLASVFVLGRTVSGARRWIGFGPMSVQPSEIFKLCFVLMATWVLTSRYCFFPCSPPFSWAPGCGCGCSAASRSPVSPRCLSCGFSR
jgi:rod shape determining protein RodA